MARLHFKRIKTPPEQMPVFEDEGLLEARRLQRNGIKDVIWVAIGLAIVLVVGMIYEGSGGAERRAARQRADAAALRTPPPTAYQTTPRYPSVEDLQAEQTVREARELAAANAAANVADPALNQGLAAPTAPAYAPPPASPFGNQAGAPAANAPVGAPPPANTAPAGPPR